MVGAEADGKITITISGNSLHSQRDTNFWFATTFTLPTGTEPKQMRATIKDCADKKSIGEVVPATALWLQFTPPAASVVGLGSLGRHR